MAASTFVDLVKINITSTGTGTLTLGTAAQGFRDTSALSNGLTYSYSIQQGSNYEIGTGVYTSSGSTFTRVVSVSSNSNTPINLAAGAVISITAVSADLPNLKSNNTWTGANIFASPTANLASINLPHGTAPTSLTNGDMWTTTAGMFARINGVTKQQAFLDSSITGSAATLTTARTIAITGDLSYTSPAFDGSGNVTATGTLATVNSNTGSFGSSSLIPVITVNAKGLITAISTIPFGTIASISPPNINSGWSGVSIEQATPNRVENGIASSILMRWCTSYGPYSAGSLYPTQNDFTNNVLGIGWNITSSFTPQNTNFPAPNFRIESLYPKASRNPAITAGFILGSECHLAQHTIGTGSQEVRGTTFWWPQYISDWGYESDWSTRAAVWLFADGYGDTMAQYNFARPRGDHAYIDYFSKLVIRRNGNGDAWLKQPNAALTTSLNLEYIDSNDHLFIGLQRYQNISSWANNPLGFKGAYTIVAQNTPSSARLRYCSFSGSPTTITDIEVNGSASTILQNVMTNTHASGAVGWSIAGNGTSFYSLQDVANFRFFGMRLQSNGTSTIGSTKADGTVGSAGSAMTLDSSMKVSFVKPPILPVYTKSTLPSSPGSGAISRVSDRIDNLAMYDGAAWQRYATKLFTHPGYVAGNYYLPTYSAETAGDVLPGTNSIKARIIFIPQEITISELFTRVTTANAGNLQLAIYAASSTTNEPAGAALVTTGNISTASAATVSAAVTGGTVTLVPGWYWVAVMCDNGTAQVGASRTTNSTNAWAVGSSTLGNVLGSTTNSNVRTLNNPGSYGSWPNLTTNPTSEAGIGVLEPVIGFKVSAIP